MDPVEAYLRSRDAAHGRPGRFDDDMKKARHQERNRRASIVRARVLTALRTMHPDDYRTLYRHITDVVNAERGPLPGDNE
jgi:hypothetical protein